jgi:hypothetical protein
MCRAHSVTHTGLKSLETYEGDAFAPTLAQLGSARNGGPRLEIFYLARPLWSSNSALSSLPSFSDISEQLEDCISDRGSLFNASGPQTAQGAFAEILDVAANRGV